MKKLFLLLSIIGIVVIGCTKEEADKGNDNNNNKTEQPDENGGGSEDGVPENIFFCLDKENVTISPDGGSVDILVYSNYKWEISGISDWCTPSVKTGNANEDGQKVTFSADVAYDDREATFWFRCADEKIKFVVSQKLKKVIISDANNTFNIPAEGGIAVISYKTTVDCEVIIPEEAKDWITFAPATRGLVSENINLDIAENTTSSARSTLIKVVSKDNPDLVVEYTINQEQNNALLADENNTFTVPSEGGEVVIEYQTNVDCEVIIPEEAKDWITFAPATRGLVSESITLVVAENTTDSLRSAIVKVVAMGNAELLAEYTITQGTRYCICYTSSDGKIVKPQNSSSFDATITSNSYKDGVGVIKFNAPITLIGDSAFYGCSGLTSITIPNSVTTLGEKAFYNCSSLKSATIGESVEKIGNSAFYGCSDLKSITIPNSVTAIGDRAFCDCSSLKSVTIGDSVTAIGWCAFYRCSSLTSVTIPDSVTAIGDHAFYGCSSLTSVTIPDSVTAIGVGAFLGCSSLTSVTIPDSVTAIGYRAFYDCSKLIEVYCKPTIPPAGDFEMFSDNASGRKIYVPTASVEAYKSASDWDTYASDIVGYDF